MKTKYKMLWIDDEHDYLVGFKNQFKTFFDSYGIELQIASVEVRPDEPIIQNEIFLNNINDNELDLVLIDFNMREYGNTIIRHIRKNLHHYHIPIVFYSGDGPNILQEKILEENIKNNDISDGIYFCDKKNLYIKTEKILVSLLKKEEEPQRVRGLLMDRVSEIDAQILDIINSDIINNLTQENQDVLKDYLISKINKRIDNSQELLTNCTHKTLKEVMDFIVENPKKFDSCWRAEFVRKILAITNSNCGEILSDFYNSSSEQKCINALRNKYAHQTEKEIRESHTPEICKYIRVETRRHLQNLSNINRVTRNVN